MGCPIWRNLDGKSTSSSDSRRSFSAAHRGARLLPPKCFNCSVTTNLASGYAAMVLCLKLIARRWIGSIRHISIHQSFGNIHEDSSSWFYCSTALLIQITNVHQRPQRLVGEVGQLGLVTAGGGVHHAAQGLVCRRLTSTAIPRTQGRRDDTQWKQSENLWSRTHYRRSMCIYTYIYVCVIYIYICVCVIYIYIYVIYICVCYIYICVIYIYVIYIYGIYMCVSVYVCRCFMLYNICIAM